MKYSTGQIVKNYDLTNVRHQRCVVLDAANGHIAILEKPDHNHVSIDQVSAPDGLTLLNRCENMESSLEQLYQLPFSSYSILAQEDGRQCFFKCLHMENERGHARQMFDVNATLFFHDSTPRTVPRTVPANALRKYRHVRQLSREQGMEIMGEIMGEAPHVLKL